MTKFCSIVIYQSVSECTSLFKTNVDLMLQNTIALIFVSIHSVCAFFFLRGVFNPFMFEAITDIYAFISGLPRWP